MIFVLCFCVFVCGCFVFVFIFDYICCISIRAILRVPAKLASGVCSTSSCEHDFCFVFAAFALFKQSSGWPNWQEGLFYFEPRT